MNQEKKTLAALPLFAVVAAFVIVVGICVLKVPVVPLCVLVILEAGIAVMLHHAELWVHSILIVLELIAGVIWGKIVLTILCAVVYVAAIIVLMVLDKGERVNG